MVAMLPHGTWPSPISGADIAGSEVRHEEVLVAAGAVWFTRTDRETGQSRLHRWRPGGGVVAVAPGLDVRSRVHEYGEGGLMGAGELVVVADAGEQRLHRVRPDGTTTAITTPTGSRVRFSAGRPTGAGGPDGGMVVVRETHREDGGPADVVNELVLLDLDDGSQSVLVDGHDFVGDPAVGPDGWLAWSTWEHPDMPWDATVLWAGRLVDGALEEVRQVAGGGDVALADWAWQGHRLVWVDDRSGHWQLHRGAPDGGDETLTHGDIDLGNPRWALGRHSLAVVGDAILSVGVDHAHPRLGIVEDGAWTAVSGPNESVWVVAALEPDLAATTGMDVVTSELDQDGRQAVRLRAADGGVTTIDEIPPISTRAGDVADVVAITVDVDGDRTHAFFHPPANADVVGPVDDPPPLVVFVHGGPTSHVPPVLTAAKAFWTTRGVAVVDCNYRGSSGFGRAYRRAMRGRWGEIEVDDAIAVAADLARRGWVDGDRMAIRGGSAGGFTALAAATRREHPFACATSFFGVADLSALAAHTHKFESRYLDSMVGRLPEHADVYEQRSPVTNAHNLAVPLLILQGLSDRVVPPAQAEVMVDAARRNGIPYGYLTFEGEGHGFRRPENIVTWLQAELAFYGDVMGFVPHGDPPSPIAT